MPEPGEGTHLVFGRFYGIYGVFDWTMRDGKWIWESINGNDMTQFVTHWYVLPDAPTG
jgi:hypothetical protein